MPSIARNSVLAAASIARVSTGRSAGAAAPPAGAAVAGVAAGVAAGACVGAGAGAGAGAGVAAVSLGENTFVTALVIELTEAVTESNQPIQRKSS